MELEHPAVEMPRYRGRKRPGVLLLALAAAALLCAACVYRVETRPLTRDGCVLEKGGQLALEALLLDPERDAARTAFVTDPAAVENAPLGTWGVELAVSGGFLGRVRHETVSVTVADTTPPKGSPKHTQVWLGQAPRAEDCVEDIQDATAVTVAFREAPDVSRGGETDAAVVLTDEGGNRTELTVPLTVIEDTEPPVIAGARNLEIYLGETVSYKAGVTVTDDWDPAPRLEVDNSAVNMAAAGQYQVYYTATDAAGNVSKALIVLTVREKSAAPAVDEDTVLQLGRRVLSGIVRDGMTPMQKAFAIYNWTKSSIAYTGTSDKSSWAAGAHEAFTKHAGDCYTYFAAARVLLTEAGISNMDIVKSDTSHSSHFWNLINLGDGWYHFDATPRKGPGDDFFMVTDAELEAYSVTHQNSHVFDGSLYPERAEASVQDRVDYAAKTVDG